MIKKKKKKFKKTKKSAEQVASECQAADEGEKSRKRDGETEMKNNS